MYNELTIFHYSFTPTKLETVGAAFPDLPVPGVVPGSLSKVSRDRASMPYERIEVECYSGYRANERPVAFTFQDRRWQVEEIIDCWYEGEVQSDEPALDYFKVRTVEGRVFLLRYNLLFDAWAIRVPPKSAH